MIQIKLGDYREWPEGKDPLKRTETGWREGMSVEAAWESGRGTWVMRPDRVFGHDIAEVINAEEVVVATATITGISKCSDGRLALEGRIIYGAPQSEIGAATRFPHTSPNPIAYIDA